MTTFTIDDQLVDVHRRIERLLPWEHVAPAAERPRITRRLRALRRQDASVRAAAGSTREFDEKLRQLKTRLDVAERSIAADIADDAPSFVAAVETELRGWDTYLERLQTSAAEQTWQTRDQTEEAIADLRSSRIAVYERLAGARAAVGDTWQEQRARVTEARDELEQKADELSARLS